MPLKGTALLCLRFVFVSGFCAEDGAPHKGPQCPQLSVRLLRMLWVLLEWAQAQCLTFWCPLVPAAELSLQPSYPAGCSSPPSAFLALHPRSHHSVPGVPHPDVPGHLFEARKERELEKIPPKPLSRPNYRPLKLGPF